MLFGARHQTGGPGHGPEGIAPGLAHQVRDIQEDMGFGDLLVHDLVKLSDSQIDQFARGRNSYPGVDEVTAQITHGGDPIVTLVKISGEDIHPAFQVGDGLVERVPELPDRNCRAV